MNYSSKIQIKFTDIKVSVGEHKKLHEKIYKLFHQESKIKQILLHISCHSHYKKPMKRIELHGELSLGFKSFFVTTKSSSTMGATELFIQKMQRSLRRHSRIEKMKRHLNFKNLKKKIFNEKSS